MFYFSFGPIRDYVMLSSFFNLPLFTKHFQLK